ncbi:MULTISPECIES: hypothetical protein [Cohnella]|uniref:Uncharacterized protein n=1 Tax=Cohnella nanjingensis TaxID=1387779 RepID=A0A7X0RXM4_9BACL|nr:MULTISPECIES: hypothetical protein [Cohnella]MBB6674356.1 hypothetical protein [Cohnella nanjingensis]MCC3377369.1 hypothetical protein [Cohnella sp. REN36]
MKPSSYSWSFVDFAAQLADLKDDRYRQILALSTLIEVLVDKGILTPDEIRIKAAEMEAELDQLILY